MPLKVAASQASCSGENGMGRPLLLLQLLKVAEELRNCLPCEPAGTTPCVPCQTCACPRDCMTCEPLHEEHHVMPNLAPAVNYVKLHLCRHIFSIDIHDDSENLVIEHL